MQTSRSLQIIVIGSAAIVLLVVLRVWIGYDRRPAKPTPVFKAFNQISSSVEAAQPHGVATREQQGLDRYQGGKPHEPEVTTIIRFDHRGTNELQMIAKMKEALGTLGIERDERTVSQLVFARVKSDWSIIPHDFKSAPMWADTQSLQLKRKIAWLLSATNEVTNTLVPADELTIERVYTAEIGPEPPPVKDWSLKP